MPRVGEQLADELNRISTELGHPGVEALWTAAKRRKLAVKKKQVQEYVRQKSEKQVLGAPQRAAGKSISEDDNRWQMDLIDILGVEGGSRYYHFILVVANVFDRYLYARPLLSKNADDVAEKLAEILDQAPKEGRRIPQLISSDNGKEFKAEVAALLQKKNIVQRFKDPGDLNALGLLDRQIGLLKRKLQEMHMKNKKKTWTANLPAAVKALNATPKPGVLYGASPEEVQTDPEVTFMLMQDQDRAIETNERNAKRKTAAVHESGMFRPQLALGKFKRNYQATYGDPERVRSVNGGRVTSTSGNTYPLKQVKVVPVARK